MKNNKFTQDMVKSEESAQLHTKYNDNYISKMYEKRDSHSDKSKGKYEINCQVSVVLCVHYQ